MCSSRSAVPREIAGLLLRAITLLAAGSGMALAQAHDLLPAPVGLSPGSVMVYRAQNGTVMEDSIVDRREGSVWLRRRTVDPSGTESVTRRTIVRSDTGWVVTDEGGQQLIAPVPWRPRSEWEFTYRGAKYRYTHLGNEEIRLPFGTRQATKLQLAIQGRTLTMVDMWIVPVLGVVRRITRGSSPSDYELVAIRGAAS